MTELKLVPSETEKALRLMKAAPVLLACLKEAARDFAIMRYGARMEKWDAAIALAERGE